MRLRFASWNINYRLLKPGHLDLIQEIDADVLALQEVNVKFHEALENKKLYSCSDCSLRINPAPPNATNDYWRGCSLFARTSFFFSEARTLDSTKFPEQTLIAEIDVAGVPLTVCSFHTPPGKRRKSRLAGDRPGREKVEFLQSIAKWLVSREALTVFGIDANTPETEDLGADNVWHSNFWRVGESALLGEPPDRIHKLDDTYRTYVKANPLRLGEPLGASYKRGTQFCRYDFIYATPDLGIQNVKYCYDAVKGLSDHGIVVADLELPGLAGEGAQNRGSTVDNSDACDCKS